MTAGAGQGSGGSPSVPPAAGMMSSTGGSPAPPMDAGSQSGNEDAGVMSTDPCENGNKDGVETGTDCGGSACGPCPDGQGCLMDADCESSYCGNGFICARPGCDDGELNGSETDVDCGGQCQPCGSDKKCSQSSDCESAQCGDSGSCVCAPKTAADCPANQCSVIQDGCGGTISCSCPSGTQCSAGTCVACRAQDCGGCAPLLETGCCKSNGMCGCKAAIDFLNLGCR